MYIFAIFSICSIYLYILLSCPVDLCDHSPWPSPLSVCYSMQPAFPSYIDQHSKTQKILHLSALQYLSSCPGLTTTTIIHITLPPSTLLQPLSTLNWQRMYLLLETINRLTILQSTVLTFVLWAVYKLLQAIYNITLHPLAGFPGPVLAGASYWYEGYFDLILWGRYTSEIAHMHEKYGNIELSWCLVDPI